MSSEALLQHFDVHQGSATFTFQRAIPTLRPAKRNLFGAANVKRPLENKKEKKIVFD